GFLLLISLCAGAQESNRKSETNDQSFNGQKQVTLQGCLTGSRGYYTLATNNDNLYQLKSDENFKDYSGKFVEISGVKGSPEPDTPRNPHAARSVLSTAPPVVDVSSIKTLHGTCQ
ncbi:MAG: hypothetical protein ACXVZV_05070, partial [Terriglobales bacterium]